METAVKRLAHMHRHQRLATVRLWRPGSPGAARYAVAVVNEAVFSRRVHDSGHVA